MTETRNELFDYIDRSLKNNFEKTAVLKESEKSSIYLYTHTKSGEKIIERISKNRNDEVFRAVRNKDIENFATVLEVCSTDFALIRLEKYIEG